MPVHQFGSHPHPLGGGGAGFNEVRRRRIRHLFPDPLGRQRPEVAEQALSRAPVGGIRQGLRIGEDQQRVAR